MADKTWNKNVRFNMNSEDAVQAWSLLHSDEVDREFKSQNEFIICAINDFYKRHISTKNDPYLETREKEDAFLERVETAVRDGVKESAPMAIAKNLMGMLVPFVKESVGEINLPDRTLTMEKTDGEIAEDNLDWEKEADMDAALDFADSF